MTCSKGRRPTVDRPPSRSPRECPAGVEPACPVWKTGASTARPRAHFNLRWSGRRGSRTPKAHRSPVFETGAVARRLALPLIELQGRDSNPHAFLHLINNQARLPFLHPGLSRADMLPYRSAAHSERSPRCFDTISLDRTNQVSNVRPFDLPAVIGGASMTAESPRR
jgi:hypothetical protein